MNSSTETAQGQLTCVIVCLFYFFTSTRIDRKLVCYPFCVCVTLIIGLKGLSSKCKITFKAKRHSSCDNIPKWIRKTAGKSTPKAGNNPAINILNVLNISKKHSTRFMSRYFLLTNFVQSVVVIFQNQNTMLNYYKFSMMNSA